MERMIRRALLSKFDAVPRRTVVLYDWHSPEGREFLEAVRHAIDNGMDAAEVGAHIGIRDFSVRWKTIGRENR